MFPSPIASFHLACRAGVYADVRLGSPQLSDCGGLGICSIMLRDHPIAHPHCAHSIPAFLRLDPATGRLLIHLEEACLTPALRSRHLPGDCLQLPRAYELSRAVSQALGLAANGYSIGPGRYPLLYDGVFATCSFSLETVKVRPRYARRPAA